MVHGRSRREAWADALREAGPARGACVEADFSAESGAGATRELLDLAEPPDRDRLRQRPDGDGRLSLAARPRHRVPGELSITGFDDTEIAAHLHRH